MAVPATDRRIARLKSLRRNITKKHLELETLREERDGLVLDLVGAHSERAVAMMSGISRSMVQKLRNRGRL